MNTTELYTQWLEKATADPDLQAELQAIAGQDEEIRDRFYRSLEFGTAGLRGVIGAGTNRMNVYTVGRATQGLADYLNAKYDHPSVAIGYDSRIKSDLFSKEAAAVLAGNGIKVYLYEELEPTPCLSFAVRQLGAQSGIILTASHNPAKYNGYKCYNKNGYQMTDDEAAETYHYIEKVDYFTGIQKANFDAAVVDGTVEYIGEKMMTAFLNAVETQCMNRGVCQKADLKVIYTPLNGTGNKPVRAILDRIGVPHVYVVPEQELPAGTIETKTEPTPTHGIWTKIPLVRGAISMVESLIMGYRYMMYSAQVSMGDDYDAEAEESAFEKWVGDHLGKKAEDILLAAAAVVGGLFAILLFTVLPTVLVGGLNHLIPLGRWGKVILEAVLKVAIFLTYMVAISKMKEIHRVFEYHGAEHKTIACYEAGDPLTVENVRKYTRFHPRCGTSFLILVVIVSVFLYSVLPWSSTGLRVVFKLLLLPVVMGISYELLKWCGRSDNIATRIIRQPGIWVQHLTVFEPDDSMIEVAIAAVTPVLPEDPEDGRW